MGRYVNHGANQPAIRMVSPPLEQVFGSDKSVDPCWPCRKRNIQNVLSNRALVSSITTSFFSAKASIWSWSACEDVLTLIHIYITILNHIKHYQTIYLIILYQIKSYETYKLLPCSTSAVASGSTDATRWPFQLSNFRRSGAGTSAKPWRRGRPGPLGSGYSIYRIYNIYIYNDIYIW